MVTIGVFMILLSLVYVIAKIRKWLFVDSKWFRWLIVLGGPLTFLAIEAGWWLAEVGRQPWILVKYMKVADAATTSGNVGLMAILFGILYVILGIGSVVVLVRMFKSNPVERELADRKMEGGDSK